MAEMLKAREIVIAPRLPANPTDFRTPFEAEGDVVVDCDVRDERGRKCGYHAMGPRRQVGLLMREHHKMFHSEQTGVVLLNQPRQ